MKVALACIFLITGVVSFTQVYSAELTAASDGQRKTSSEDARSMQRNCSVANLQKLIVPATAMHPPSPAGEPFNKNLSDTLIPGEPVWSIWDGEFDTPSSITVRLISRIGEVIFRVSFLGRHNYVMSETVFDYPDNVNVLSEQKRPVTVSPGRASHIFFCADQVQIPPGATADEAEKATIIGNDKKSWFFEEAVPVTGVDLKKIPEN